MNDQQIDPSEPRSIGGSLFGGEGSILGSLVGALRRLADALGIRDGETAVVQQNGTRMQFPVVVDDKVPDGCAGLASGIVETAALTPALGPMSIEKA